MSALLALQRDLEATWGDNLQISLSHQELSLELKKEDLLSIARQLKEDPRFSFAMLIDLCGVDYLEYGLSEWETEKASLTGFSRAVKQNQREMPWDKPRFAVVYHLLSLSQRLRLRLKVFLEAEKPLIPSVVSIWPNANWYEREAFDLYGIMFENHPDLRRLLTDYGFRGHPFRKDFPLVGELEVRYSALDARVVYEPVKIEPRQSVPKVIRKNKQHERGEGS